ncbi:hypothetical protein FRC10_009150 [Ceratobasidium sp. 414]|nr:hypothetical protein FRC10_009150 [Ceratobasidium sp. 414]
MASEHKVVIQGETFLLSRDQIEFDSPNFFTEYFLDDTCAHKHSIKLSRNPHLFALIVEYLSGYAILPISGTALAAQMDQENALKNLRVDAEFYNLQGLKRLIDAYTQITVLLTIVMSTSCHEN